MPREIDSTTATTLTDTIVPLAVLVEITLTGGAVLNLWSGYGPLTYSGHTWLGVGKLGKLSIIQEGNSVFANGATIGLEGVDTADLADALTEITIGQPVYIYLAIVSNGAVVGALIPIYAGNTDQVSIAENVDGCTISIAVESKLAQLQRNREYRYTDQMQRYLYPSDAAFQYVNMLTDYIGTWGFALGDQS